MTAPIAVALVCLTTTLCWGQQEFFVAADGSPAGSGSLEAPWDLKTAFLHPRVVEPGSVIWLRGGTYKGTFVSRLNGLAEAPIFVIGYPGERATLDSGSEEGVILTVSGAHTWFWGFEIKASNPDRFLKGDAPLRIATGVSTDQCEGCGVGSKFINLVVHDTALAFAVWKEAIDAEVYGCLIYNNGWDMADRGHGHAIYSQNTVGTKRLTDNIAFQQYGEGIHIYGSREAPLSRFYLEGNILFSNGVVSQGGFSRNLLIGGGQVADRIAVIDNYTYFPNVCCGTNDIGWGAGCSNLEMTGNYFINSGDTALKLGPCMITAFSDNTFLGQLEGFTADNLPQNSFYRFGSPPDRVVVRPNQYEPGRAHIAIYNWSAKEKVNIASVDLEATGIQVGETYRLRNVQDYYGNVLTGVYDGHAIDIPLSGWKVAAPTGGMAPPSSLPEFGVFVLSR